MTPDRGADESALDIRAAAIDGTHADARADSVERDEHDDCHRDTHKGTLTFHSLPLP